MGITDKISDVSNSLQQNVKSSSVGLVLFSFKAITCAFFGYCISVVLDEFVHYNNLLFVFVMLASGGLLFRLVKDFSFPKTLIFQLILVLVALLLRMYVMLAP